MTAYPPTTASSNGNLHFSSKQSETKLKPLSRKKRSKTAKKKTTAGYELLDEATKEEVAEKWEKLEIAELKLFVEKAKLVAEQTRSILEALQNSFSTH